MTPSEILDFTDDMEHVLSNLSMSIEPYGRCEEMKPFIKAMNTMYAAVNKMINMVTYSEEYDTDGTCEDIGL